MSHPIRKADIHIFNRIDDGEFGARFIGRFYPYNAYPVFAQGETPKEVRDKLEALRTEAIEKYEAQVIARQEAQAKRKATLAAKKAAKA